MKILAILLLPISYLYGALIHLRNLCYDMGLFSSRRFETQIISIGNLSVGGTGKTPHIEYVARLLMEDHEIAILSRGYKRKTKGFIQADEKATPHTIGDEPYQIHRKFPNLRIATDEKRARGIERLMGLHPTLDVILLDDAFQHRAVQPGLNILLTDYHHLYVTDYLLPSGRLREFRSGAKRADIIVVTKTPSLLSPLEKRRLRDELAPMTYQKLYFSYVNYGDFVPLYPEQGGHKSKQQLFDEGCEIILVTGIASARNLFFYLKNNCKAIEHEKFPDHHDFTREDAEQVSTSYKRMYGTQKIVVMTEKDAVKWKNDGLGADWQDIPLYYVPIEVAFHQDDSDDFDTDIKNYVLANTTHHRINSQRSQPQAEEGKA